MYHTRVMIEEDQLLDISAHCAHFNLKKATRAATRLYDEALASTGLGISQFTLLVASALAGPQSISDLAAYLAMDRSTLSRNVQPLVKQGLLNLSPGEDSRTRLIEITDKGREILTAAYPLWQSVQGRVRRMFGAKYSDFLERTQAFLEFP